MLNETPERILHCYSWANLSLYAAAQPDYNGDGGETTTGDTPFEWDDAMDANNPNNFRHLDTNVKIYK